MIRSVVTRREAVAVLVAEHGTREYLDGAALNAVDRVAVERGDVHPRADVACGNADRLERRALPCRGPQIGCRVAVPIDSADGGVTGIGDIDRSIVADGNSIGSVIAALGG